MSALTGVLLLSTVSASANNVKDAIAVLKEKLPPVTRLKGSNCLKSHKNEVPYLTVKHTPDSIFVTVEAITPANKKRTMFFYLGNDSSNYGDRLHRFVQRPDEVFLNIHNPVADSNPATQTGMNLHSVHVKEMILHTNGPISRLLEIENYSLEPGTSQRWSSVSTLCYYTY